MRSRLSSTAESFKLIVLLQLALLSLLLSAFWYISIDLKYHETWGLDVVMFMDSKKHHIVNILVKYFSMLGFEIFFIIIPFFAWGNSPNYRVFAMWFALILTEGLFIQSTLKMLFARPRPSHPNLWEIDTDTAKGEVFSFPSGHSFGATLGWFFLAFHIKRLDFTLLSIAIVTITGLTRVYLSVHYPHDIFAGVLLGFITLRLWFHLLHPHDCLDISLLKQKSNLAKHIIILIIMVLSNAFFRERTVSLAVGGFHVAPTISFALLLSAYFVDVTWSGGASNMNVIARLLAGLPIIFFLFTMNLLLYRSQHAWSGIFMHISVFISTLWMFCLAPWTFSWCGLAKRVTRVN